MKTTVNALIIFSFFALFRGFFGDSFYVKMRFFHTVTTQKIGLNCFNFYAVFSMYDIKNTFKTVFTAFYLYYSTIKKTSVFTASL